LDALVAFVYDSYSDFKKDNLKLGSGLDINLNIITYYKETKNSILLTFDESTYFDNWFKEVYYDEKHFNLDEIDIIIDKCIDVKKTIERFDALFPNLKDNSLGSCT